LSGFGPFEEVTGDRRGGYGSCVHIVSEKGLLSDTISPFKAPRDVEG